MALGVSVRTFLDAINIQTGALSKAGAPPPPGVGGLVSSEEDLNPTRGGRGRGRSLRPAELRPGSPPALTPELSPRLSGVSRLQTTDPGASPPPKPHAPINSLQ